MLNILDEFSRERLSIRVKRKLNSTDDIDALTDLFILRGPARLSFSETETMKLEANRSEQPS